MTRPSETQHKRRYVDAQWKSRYDAKHLQTAVHSDADEPENVKGCEAARKAALVRWRRSVLVVHPLESAGYQPLTCRRIRRR